MNMNPQMINYLENIIDECKSEDRAVAFAALTLARVLSSEWTCIIDKKTVVKPAGQIVGNREELEKRFDAHIQYLKSAGVL